MFFLEVSHTDWHWFTYGLMLWPYSGEHVSLAAEKPNTCGVIMQGQQSSTLGAVPAFIGSLGTGHSHNQQ